MAEVKVERWKPHLEAAKAQGISLAEYARQHGLSRHTLYMTNTELRRSGQAEIKPCKPSTSNVSKTDAFVPVKIRPSEASLLSLRVVLPNGVEMHCDAVPVQVCTTFVIALATLPCSR
jgi:hypothetical protein